MKIIEIKTDRKKYLDLLLLADEQESMIDRYLEAGTMYALSDPDVRAVCVVTDNGDGTLEIKNIAVAPEYQHSGLGKEMIRFIEDRYRDSHNTLIVGTGDSELTIPFYKKCGFEEAYRVKNFFTDNYDHPIIECGKQLIDMVYLKKEIRRI